MRVKLSYWAVATAATASLVASAAYYTVLGGTWLRLRGIHPGTATLTPQAWQIIGQLGRNLIIAAVLAYFLRRLKAATWKDAVRIGLLLWFGFEAMAVAGSVLHEGYPLGLYAIHVGDALLATLVMALILGTWHRTRGQQAKDSPATSITPDRGAHATTQGLRSAR
jgi:Protein of unknown function (DUF1761)